MKYDYNTFKDLFDGHIHYAYEGQYGAYLDKIEDTVQGEVCVEAATFHKLTIFDIGWLEYKGQYQTYDPRLWPKVKLLAEMLQETPAEKILFKAKPEIDEP